MLQDPLGTISVHENLRFLKFLALGRSKKRLEGRIMPNGDRHVLRVVYVNRDGTVASEYTVDPWVTREQDRDRGNPRTPTSPQSRCR